MITWVKPTEANKKPPKNRPLLAYCPDFCEVGYEVVIWNGHHFSNELHGTAIHDYVQQWSLIYEAE
jgi:hypothetical protein